MDKYSLRKRIKGVSECSSSSSDAQSPQFADFYVDNIRDGCGIVLRAKKKFRCGEKLMDLCGKF